MPPGSARRVENNDAYAFVSDNALGATEKFGVKSISLRAVKPERGGAVRPMGAPPSPARNLACPVGLAEKDLISPTRTT